MSQLHRNQIGSGRWYRALNMLPVAIGLLFVSLGFIGLLPDSAFSASGDGVFSNIAEWFTDDIINGKGTSISTDGMGHTTATWSDGRDKLKVRIDGDVEFADEDRAIRRISRGGSIAIWEKRGSETRELKVTVSRDGQFEYDYRVDGKNAEFDASGEAWLASVLVDIVRKTGIGAEERANRIMDKDGVDGLLMEIKYVESDYVMRVYLGAALSRPDLTTADCASILEEASLSMDSDYEKAELLLSVARHQSWNSSLAVDYIGVASTMESDYEIRRSVSAITLDETTDERAINAILEVAARMESDYEVAELLISLAPSCNGSQRLSEMYVHAVAGIDSDYEARRALSELAWESGMSANAVEGALMVAGRLESDYEAAELLSELAPYSRDDSRSVAAFMGAIANVDSDYEASRSLVKFVSASDLDEPTVLAALDAAKGISSSYEQSIVLKKIVRHCRGNDTLEDAYLDAVETVDADYERETLFSDFYRGERESRRARRGE